MEIIEAIERSPIVLPIGRVMDAAGNFSFVSEVQKKGYFDVDYRQNELVLVAGKYVGQIPLTPSLAIHVKPKVPLSNLARLISVANEPVHSLEFFRRRYAISDEDAESFQEGMAKAFVSALKSLDSEGVYREYKRFEEITSTPKGKINLGSYISTSLSRGKPLAVPCQYHLLDADTAFNRAIKLALFTIGNSLSELRTKNRALIREIEYFYELFPGVQLEPASSLTQRVRRELEQKRIPDLRHYYVDILDIALVIIQQGCVEISSPTGQVRMSSFILNLEDTFEKYLRGLLVNSAQLKARNLSVEDGNTNARGKLFFDNTLYDAKPDFVLRDSTANTIIGDAKYKLKTNEADRYQVITHSLSFNSQFAFIALPANENVPSGPHAVGSINRAHPIRLFEYRFDLNSRNLAEEESKFCQWVASLSNPDVAVAA